MSTLVLEHQFYQNPAESSYLLRREISPEPSYALRDSSPMAPPILDRLIVGAVARAGTLPNARMNGELDELVKQLRVALAEAEIDLSTASKLEVIDADDGSVLIEWHFSDRRLGFNIEPQEGQSGWYFALSKDSGGQCGSGLLASLDMKTLLHLMFTKSPTR